MSEDKNFKDCTNDELLKMMNNLNENHEKVKFEMMILNEMLTNIQKQFVEINDELNSRI
jgi:hypothetical protein